MAQPIEPFSPQTSVLWNGPDWRVNNQVTYLGSRAQGLLMNVRMANAVFEDAAHPEIDPEDITARFIRRIPDYLCHGILAFTLCLQGGFPGYEGAINSAFASDGSLRPVYMERVRRVIEACDRLGAVVILGCYYQRQVSVLRDEQAVRTGIVNVARWIQAHKFTNILVETTNEYGHRGFSDPIFTTPEGQVELLRLFKETASGLLVSTARQGHKGLDPEVCQQSDFILLHFNNVPVEEVPGVITAAKSYGKPIICNEDRKTGEEGAQVAEICVANGCSWGLMAREVNQYTPPFRFEGAQDDPVVYAKLKELTSQG